MILIVQIILILAFGVAAYFLGYRMGCPAWDLLVQEYYRLGDVLWSVRQTADARIRIVGEKEGTLVTIRQMADKYFEEIASPELRASTQSRVR